MKNTIYATIILSVVSLEAHGAKNCCASAQCLVGQDNTYDSSCTSDDICNCKDEITINSYGIQVTQPKKLTTSCLGGIASASCMNSGRATYSCAPGSYGTATSSSAGCTICPTNATCDGGNDSTFKCNIGYYKDGTACSRCPSSGGIYGTTAAIGATDATECYIPSGTTFSDSTGSGIYTSNCYYTK